MQFELLLPKKLLHHGTSQTGNLPSIPSAIPTELRDPPEDFFALAALNCRIAIYQVFWGKSNRERHSKFP